MSDNNSQTASTSTHLSLGFLFWLGGAVHTANLDGMNFWDGVIWLYYVGRALAKWTIG